MEYNQYNWLAKMMQQLNDNIFHHLKSNENNLVSYIDGLLDQKNKTIDKLSRENLMLKRLLAKYNINSEEE